jgi:hypothetical protein
LTSGCIRCPVTATRFLASAKAALVRVEIILRSAWAMTAMMPTTSSLASGMSAATNRTPAFCSPSRKWASRDSRSSLAIRSVEPVSVRDHHFLQTAAYISLVEREKMSTLAKL